MELVSAPGPIYDNALRYLAASELAALCGWLGIDAHGENIRVSEALAAVTRYADLLISTGPDLVHVEFVRRVTPDLPLRMLDYRARIMMAWPGTSLTQILVVLADGHVPEHLHDQQALHHRTHVTYLRDADPTTLLSSPALAPLASLALATTPAERTDLLRRALIVIRDHAPPERCDDLASTALVLAAIRLDPDTIDTARKEADMPISLEGTLAGDIIAQRAHTRGHTEGRTEGLAVGRTEGEITTLITLLTTRFGDDPRVPDLARILHTRAGLRTIPRILAAATLDDLLATTDSSEPMDDTTGI